MTWYGSGARWPINFSSMAWKRSSMVDSSQDSNRGVTGSEIHSPKRSWRVYGTGRR